jgi:invasion protein IalB
MWWSLLSAIASRLDDRCRIVGTRVGAIQIRGAFSRPIRWTLVGAICSHAAFAQPSGRTPDATAPSLAPTIEAAANGPQPKETVTRFVNWELICPPDSTAPEAAPVGDAAKGSAKGSALGPRSAPQTSCRVSQRLAAKGSSETIFMVNIVPNAVSNLPAMIISTPQGGYLVPGMELRIDKGQPMRVLYETCNTSGCHAGFTLTETVRSALLAGALLQVRLWTTRSEPVDVDVSLAGLTAAMKGLTGARR